MTSPSNPVVNVIKRTQEFAGSSSTTPQTDAALSQKLLDILQYREPGRGSTPGDATPPNGNTRTASEGSGADRGRNSRGFPPPFRSETLNTVGSDIWETALSEAFPVAPAVPEQQNPNQHSESLDDTQNPQESPVAVPKISIHPLTSISDTSSPVFVNGPGSQQATPTELRIERGALDPGGNAGNRAKKSKSARKPESQRRRPSEQGSVGPDQNLSALSATKPSHESANPSLQPMERTPSRSSSIRKGGYTILVSDPMVYG